MEIINAILLYFASAIIIFQVFFIKYLQNENEKLLNQNKRVLEFYEWLFKEIFKVTNEFKKIKNNKNLQ